MENKDEKLRKIERREKVFLVIYDLASIVWTLIIMSYKVFNYCSGYELLYYAQERGVFNLAVVCFLLILISMYFFIRALLTNSISCKHNYTQKGLSVVFVVSIAYMVYGISSVVFSRNKEDTTVVFVFVVTIALFIMYALENSIIKGDKRDIQ